MDPTITPTKYNYQVIHSLLRVIKNGLECKRAVDETIDRCSATVNLREAIEKSRLQAENSTDDPAKQKKYIEKGILHLKRYFLLIVFQSYLNDTSPNSLEDLESFKQWFSRHQELHLMKKEFDKCDIHALIPVEYLQPGTYFSLTP